jgi:hypothetical protein
MACMGTTAAAPFACHRSKSPIEFEMKDVKPQDSSLQPAGFLMEHETMNVGQACTWVSRLSLQQVWLVRTTRPLGGPRWHAMRPRLSRMVEHPFSHRLRRDEIFFYSISHIRSQCIRASSCKHVLLHSCCALRCPMLTGHRSCLQLCGRKHNCRELRLFKNTFSTVGFTYAPIFSSFMRWSEAVIEPGSRRDGPGCAALLTF